MLTAGVWGIFYFNYNHVNPRIQQPLDPLLEITAWRAPTAAGEAVRDDDTVAADLQES